MYRGDMFFQSAQSLQQRELKIVVDHYNATDQPFDEGFQDWIYRNSNLAQQYWEAAIVMDQLHPRPIHYHEMGA